jgi:hypothetical protein
MKLRTVPGLISFASASLVAGAIAFTASPAAAGNAYGKDDNPGNANGHAENGGPAATGNGNRNLASAMGSLNAAHASSEGLDNANRDYSRVGMLASYMDAMAVYEDFVGQVADLIDGGAAEGDSDVVENQGLADAALLEATGYLENAANKEINDDVVDAVDGLLDGK